MKKEEVTEEILDYIAEAIVDSILFFQGIGRSAITIVLAGVIAYGTWNGFLTDALPRITLVQALIVAFLGRVLIGYRADPPVSKEMEQAWQDRADEEDASLRIVPNDKAN